MPVVKRKNAPIRGLKKTTVAELSCALGTSKMEDLMENSKNSILMKITFVGTMAFVFWIVVKIKNKTIKNVY